MKRLLCILAAAFLLCGCSKEVSVGQESNPGTEVKMQNTTESTAYDLNELRAFFVPRHGCVIFSELPEKILSYEEVNMQFPVGNISYSSDGTAEYTEYPVKQGGYYYIFWGYAIPISDADIDLRYNIPESMLTLENAYVYYSLYMPDGNEDGVYSDIDYFAIKTGITTMADVIRMDPYVEIHKFASGIYSTSMMDSDTVLSVWYRYDQTRGDLGGSGSGGYDPEAWVVYRVEVEGIEDSRSSYGKVNAISK